MNILPLLPDTAPELRVAVPVLDRIDDVTRTVLEDMHRTREVYSAIGLAANQCGLAMRMFVMGNAYSRFSCINPEIVTESEEQNIADEGCLSFPGLLLKVQRPTVIQVRYTNEFGKQVECEFSGLMARCYQHELDHLNGVVFVDKVSKLKLAMARKKANKFRF